MATQQHERGVPFAMAHEMQQFRLFELPPEIVELLDAPSPPLLSIKSHAASHAPNPPPAYAVLCTPSTTFQLRQVHTSNSLFITQPAPDTHGNQFPAPLTCAIASCATTLELHPSTASAVALLRDALPVYDLTADDMDATANGPSMAAVFDDIPLSHAQCLSAWSDLIAFELPNGSYRPSANFLVHAWSAINAAALAEGVRLESQFLTDDITRAVAEEGIPPALIAAILRHLAKEDQQSDMSWSCLDRTRTISFVGKTLLEAKPGSDYPIADFTDTWKDKLPEAWRRDVQLSAIEGTYLSATETTIRAKSIGIPVTVQDATAVANKPSARKWHEKFGKTRKQ
ncbi:sister chromatid cohesion protein-like protein Dcc1 [Phaeosphaeria sp. MPI-PUGE-AT-0046c]|nr:sister chromatid cohesion protein-like protein Dcc1 [Phaeosphaeria sp. MPI-PUGE-AT-0046c]